MGVKDLWKLLEPTGRPVTLESLGGLVLAVDVSIWLNQAVKGMRDRHGNTIPQAHLVVLFNRVCKLLYYHIKPVFVFDGVMPTVKKQTLAARSRKRDIAVQRSLKATDKQMTKFLQAKILEQLYGEGSTCPPPSQPPSATPTDIFELPPLPEAALSKDKTADDMSVTLDLVSVNAYNEEVAALDIYSEEFSSLPPDVQHELLLERQLMEKHSHNDPDSLPQEANDFSSYQLSKLVTQSRTSQKLEEIRKILKSTETASMGLSGEANIHDVETSKILSKESASYILVRGTDIDRVSSQGESIADSAEHSSEKYAKGEIDIDSDSGEPVSDCTSVINIGSRLADGAYSSLDLNTVSDLHECSLRPSYGIMSDSKNVPATFKNDLEPFKTCGSQVMLEAFVSQMPKDSGSPSLEPKGSGSPSLELKDSGSPSLEPKGSGSPSLEPKGSGSPSLEPKGSGSPSLEPKGSGSPSLELKDSGSPSLELKGSGSPLLELKDSGSPLLEVKDSSSPLLELKPSLELKDSGSPLLELKDSGSPSLKLKDSGSPLLELKDSGSPLLEVKDSGSPLLELKDSGSPSLELKDSGSLLQEVKDSEPQGTLSQSTEALPDTLTSLSIDKLSNDNNIVKDKSIRRTESLQIDEAETVYQTQNEDLFENQSESNKFHISSPILTTPSPPHVQLLLPDHRYASELEEQSQDMASHTRWEGNEEIDRLVSLPLLEAQNQLGREVSELGMERGRQDRAAASVSNIMYKESQELLSLFGLPFLVAPTEAEAQCACLENEGLTQGSITDDNDVFLFGGKTVYRNFFAQGRAMEVFKSAEVQSRLGLSRDQLIVLAYLLGSDYTNGLEGVGIVSAMELLRDFPGTGVEPLQKLKDWHEETTGNDRVVNKVGGVLKKLAQIALPANFPDRSVYEAYLYPAVDPSSEEFEWGKPDLDLLRKFASDKIGWDQVKVDSILLPVLKRMNAKPSHQQPITAYLSRALPDSVPDQRKGISSRRIRNAVARLTNKDVTSHSPSNKQGHVTTRPPKRGRHESPSSPIPKKSLKTNKRARNQKSSEEDFEQTSSGFAATGISASSSDSDC